MTMARLANMGIPIHLALTWIRMIGKMNAIYFVVYDGNLISLGLALPKLKFWLKTEDLRRL